MAIGHKTGGRAKGTPNKTTLEVRKSIQTLVENNLPNLQDWISKTAETNPTKAVELILKMAEIILPKNIEIESFEVRSIDPIQWVG